MTLFGGQRTTSRPAESPQPPAPTVHLSDTTATGYLVIHEGYVIPPQYAQVREAVQSYLVNEVKTLKEGTRSADVRKLVEPVYHSALQSANLVLSRTDRDVTLDMILDDILGYGPIQPLLDRTDITEVMVNGPKQVYVERDGKIVLTNVTFIDNDHVMAVLQRIVAPLGRRIDEASPMVDGRLPDGSRVNAIIPPLSLVGPVVTVRKFRRVPYKASNLVDLGMMTQEFNLFIEAAVVARMNIVISGGTGSGKTTFLNMLSGYIPANERIVTIEDAAELQLQQPHVVRLEKRPPNIEGRGEVTIRDLVMNSLRMRPDRIIVGESRGGEALDMLQAMNTGHDGSMTTVHSNSPRDTLSRIETMVLMAGMDLPSRSIRQQEAAAIDLIIHLERMSDGVRRVVRCAEIVGMEGDTILMQDLFQFRSTGIDEKGRVRGELRPTGLRPRINDKIEAAGLHLPATVFGLGGGPTTGRIGG